MKLKLLLVLTCGMLLFFGCDRDDDDDDNNDNNNENTLSQLSCEKDGVYCYSPKEGFGIDTLSCKEDGGSVVKVCDPNPVLVCDKEAITIQLYDDDYKDADCNNVGLPVEVEE